MCNLVEEYMPKMSSVRTSGQCIATQKWAIFNFICVQGFHVINKKYKTVWYENRMLYPRETISVDKLKHISRNGFRNGSRLPLSVCMHLGDSGDDEWRLEDTVSQQAAATGC